MGPSGKMLVTGEVTEEDLEGAFTAQASALALEGAHALVVETMTDLREAVLAVTAAKKTGLPVVGCLVFDSGKEKDRTMMGVTLEQAVPALLQAGADAVGANCGQGSAGYLAICRRLRTLTSSPIWLKPNAGLPVIEGGKTIYHAKPAQFAQEGRQLKEAGADFLGGCCGTSPDFIRALGGVLKS